MANLEFDHPSTVQEMSETNLAIEENEDTVVIEEKKKTQDVLVLKELLGCVTWELALILCRYF